MELDSGALQLRYLYEAQYGVSTGVFAEVHSKNLLQGDAESHARYRTRSLSRPPAAYYCFRNRITFSETRLLFGTLLFTPGQQTSLRKNDKSKVHV